MKWNIVVVVGIIIMLAIGGWFGVKAVYGLFISDDSAISTLRTYSERAAEQYRAEIDDYKRLLGEARGTIGDLRADLNRERAARREDVARAWRAERRAEAAEIEARSLRDLDRTIRTADRRAAGYNQRIGDETEAALQELREYRAALEGGAGDS